MKLASKALAKTLPLRDSISLGYSVGNNPFISSCKIPEFFDKSPLSGAEKHSDFQVTSCHHFVTTNADFAYIESE